MFDEFGGRKFISVILAISLGFILVLLNLAKADSWFPFVNTIVLSFIAGNLGESYIKNK